MCTGVDIFKVEFVCFLSLRINVFNFGKFSVIISSKITFLHSFYPLLLSPLWRGSLRIPSCVPSLISQSQARDWEPPIYFPRAVLWSVYGLCLESWRMEPTADILCCLWGFVYTLCGSTCTAFAEAHMHCLGSMCGVLGAALASWGCCRWEVPQDSRAGLLVESESQLVGPMAGFWDPSGGCYEPLWVFPDSSSLRTIQLCQFPQWSGWGKKEVGFLGNISPVWGSQVLTLLSFSPMGEIAGKCLSWQWAVPPCEEGVTQVKWNCFSHPLQCVCPWILNGVLETFHWTPGFSQRYSHPWMVVKLVFLSG